MVWSCARASFSEQTEIQISLRVSCPTTLHFFQSCLAFHVEASNLCLLDVNPQLKVSSFPTAPGQTRVLMIRTILKHSSQLSQFPPLPTQTLSEAALLGSRQTPALPHALPWSLSSCTTSLPKSSPPAGPLQPVVPLLGCAAGSVPGLSSGTGWCLQPAFHLPLGMACIAGNYWEALSGLHPGYFKSCFSPHALLWKLPHGPPAAVTSCPGVLQGTSRGELSAEEFSPLGCLPGPKFGDL